MVNLSKRLADLERSRGRGPHDEEHQARLEAAFRGMLTPEEVAALEMAATATAPGAADLTPEQEEDAYSSLAKWGQVLNRLGARPR